MSKRNDGIDMIGEGEHERVIVHWDKFEALVNKKAKLARVAPVRRRVP